MEGQSYRLLLAFLLMAAVLVGSQWWYARLSPPDAAAPADTTKVVAPDTVVAGLPEAPGALGDTAESTAATAPSPARNRLLEDRAAPALVRIETPLYRAWIDPAGGRLAQVELVRYPSFADTSAVTLVPPGESFLRRVVDLGETRVRIDEHLFAPSDSVIHLAEGDPPRELRLAYEDAEGSIVQTFRFAPDTYVVDYTLDLGRRQNGVLVTGIGPRLHSNEKNPREDYGQLRAVVRVDQEIVSRQAKDQEESGPAQLSGRIDWAGLRTKYFLGAVLAPPDGPPLTAATIDGERGDSLPTLEVTVASPLTEGRSVHRLYFGPQEYRRLAELNEGLDGVQQYGWSWIRWMIDPFAKLAVIVMLWLHRFVPSYGLVLIIFSVLVRLVLWPLTVKSYRSIQEMQRLQPDIQRLRERYKDDPQRMQQETMRLYRERKVNPLGGCLPNLIPMPILFALFFVFQGTIEFRGQPFLWLPDLSQPDPIYILPIFMGLTMFASSKMTTTDPKMSAMTYVMPIVLTFVFLNLAAGLVLYYAFSNLLTFGQQWWIRRAEGGGAEAEGAPS